MTRDQLYELAFQYKKTKLWKRLWEDDIFAVKLSRGEIGYVSVMGNVGEYCAIGLYIGDAGIQSYLQLKNMNYPENEFAAREMLLQQNCLHLALETKDGLMPEEVKEVRAYAKANGIRLSGKNTYPQLVKFTPNYHPWKVTEDADLQSLYEAVQACLQLSKLSDDNLMQMVGVRGFDRQLPLYQVRNGELLVLGVTQLPKLREIEYPMIPARNDILIAKANKLPHKGVWEAELVRYPEPLQENPEDAPYYPLLLFIVNNKDEYAHVTPIKAEEDEENSIDLYVKSWLDEKKYPKEIRCRDARTYAFLKEISDKTKVKISIYHGPMEALDEAEQEFLLSMDDGDYPEDEALDALFEELSDETGEDGEIVMYRLMASMPAEALQTMPADLKRQLKMVIKQGLLPQDIADEISGKMGW